MSVEGLSPALYFLASWRYPLTMPERTRALLVSDPRFWEDSAKRMAEDDLAFLDFYSWLLLPDAEAREDEPLPDDLARRLFRAMARVDRFRFRRLAVSDLRLLEGGLFAWFKSLEGESRALVASLAAHRGWSGEAARRYLFSTAPPFVRAGARIPEKVERYYSLAGVEYVHGHAEACIALCRAALEGIFKAETGHRGGKTFSLGEAIDRLFRQGVLAGPCLKSASAVNDGANRVLHKLGEARPGADEAIFGHLRAFIEGWYGEGRGEGRKEQRTRG
jgi:hypothetical protein